MSFRHGKQGDAVEGLAINWLAIIVLAIGRNALGALWYSPVLFGTAYCRMNGISPQRMGEGMPQAILGELFGNLIAGTVLAAAVQAAHATGVMGGAQVGALAWLGFVATTSLADVTWAKRPFALWLVNNGVHLIGLTLMGGMLAVWR